MIKKGHLLSFLALSFTEHFDRTVHNYVDGGWHLLIL